MGSDLHFYSQQVMEKSHGGLIRALERARGELEIFLSNTIDADRRARIEAVLAEVSQALNNARMF